MNSQNNTYKIDINFVVVYYSTKRKMFEMDNDWGFFVDLEKPDVQNKHKLRKIVHKYIPNTTLHSIQENEEKVHSFDLKKIDNNDIYPVNEPNHFFMRVGIMIAGITISSMIIICKVI